jgi:hypothetical protein
MSEIVDMIMDHVFEPNPSDRLARHTLAQCALVCRAWVPRSRYHLFRDCVLLSENVVAFGKLLQSYKCTFILSVRHISAFRTFGDPHDADFDEVGQDLARLKNVTSLMLDGMFHAHAEFHGFMCGFKNVTELSLHFYLNGQSNCVMGMLYMLPSIRSLSATPISDVIFLESHRAATSGYHITPPATFTASKLATAAQFQYSHGSHLSNA